MKDNLNNSNIKDTGYEYTLDLFGYGGEMVVGPITDTFADYWKGKSNTTLSNYIFQSPEDRRSIPQLDGLEMGDWHEYEGVAHTFGPLLFGECSLEVLDVRTQKAVLDVKSVRDVPGLRIARDIEIDTRPFRKDAPLLKCWTHEKLGFTFGLRLDSPFNTSLLSFSTTTVDDRSYFEAIHYNDNDLHLDDVYSRSYGNGSSRILRRK